MKQKLLLLSATFLVSILGFAQWTKPVPKGTDLVMGETFYLYNVGAGGFLMGANEWGTRASVSGETGYPVIIATAPDGEEGTVIIKDVVPNRDYYNALDCQGFDNIWVDGYERDGYNMWRVTKEGQYYIITNDHVEGNLGVAEFTAFGWGEYETNNRVFMYQSDAIFSYEMDGEYFEVPLFSGTFHDKWIFVSPTEYEALVPLLFVYEEALKLKNVIDAVKAQDAAYNTKNLDAIYNNTSSTVEELYDARVIAEAVYSLSQTLTTAKSEYPSLDFSAPTTVYNNIDATAEDLAEAEQLVSVIINEYKASQATFDDPMDYTEIIGDGSSVVPWTRDFTGEGTTGSHNTNTWSTEANNGADGTDMTTPFVEHWTGSGGLLSDQKIYQVLSNALPGLYKLTINARVYSEAGKLDKFEGIKMYFGDKSIDLQEQTSITYSGSKSVLWKPDYFTIVAIVKEAGDIDFGFEITNANFNWLAFKNTSLLYYGNKDVEENAKKLLGETSDFEKVSEDTPAKAEYIKAYNDAVDTYNMATTLEAVTAALEAVKAAKAVLNVNIAAYENLFAKIEEWEKNVAEHNDLEGEEWDNFADFIQAEDDIEGYPSPSVGAIKNEGTYTLETAEIEEYITTVDKFYAHAIIASLVPGADCTDMLINPSFSTGDFTGWTIKSGTGKLGDKNVECYQTEVDIYQIVKDVPNGIYSISVQTFERPGGNGSFDGSEETKTSLFMNQFQTPVQNIVADALPEDQAEDGVNCYLNAPSGETVPAWPCDYLGEYGYIPNSVTGARIAFEAGRYEQKCYGIVENGEMKIGLTSNGKRVEWVLWANFKLTYEGKSAEALAELLPTYLEELETYIKENELSEPAKAAASQVAADGEKAIKDGDVDSMWDALLNVNAALMAAKENVEVFEECFNATIELDEAMSEFQETASEEAINNAAAVSQKAGNYESLTTEELEALTAEINEAIAALRIPQTDGATFENWVDMTCVIVNPDFETGNANGWRLTVGAQNLGFQNNASYSNGDDPEAGVISNFIEAWRPDAELSDGEISQVINFLPAGVYALDADIITWQDDPDLDVEGVYLFAQEGDDAWRCIPLATANGVPEHFTNYFVKKSADTPLTIGVGVRGANANWVAADNFTMKFFGCPDQENENCIDMTNMIVNPDMEIGNADGWIFTIDALNRGFMRNSYSNPFDENNTTISNFIEAWNSNIVFNDGEILQVINSLPAGIYTLDADIIATWQDDPELAVEGVYLFAQEGDDAWQCVPLATANGVPEHFTNYFVKKSADTPLTIGVGVRNTNANWIAADNFTLKFFGSPNQGESKNFLAISDAKAFVGKQIAVPVELVNDSEITGIQFDLILPEGITLEDYEWAGRQGKKHSANFDYNEETGTYTMLIFSSSSDPFSGNEGTLLDLVLNVDDVMEEGQYSYGMINIKLVTPDERTFRPADTYAAFFIHNTLRGDANGDGTVDITDVVSVVNYILGRPSDRFNYAGADINYSGDIDVVDVVGIVNIILQRDVAGAKSRDMEALSNALMMLSETNGMNVLVEDAAKFAAMQFDVVVSDNANLLDAILNSSSDHQIGFAKIGANRYRVIAYSTDNDSFQPTEDTLIQLVLSNGNATIENATFVAADGHSVQMKVTGDATSIAGISSENQKDVIYNMAGQRVGTSTKSLSAGIYIRNGKKIRVK